MVFDNARWFWGQNVIAWKQNVIAIMAYMQTMNIFRKVKDGWAEGQRWFETEWPSKIFCNMQSLSHLILKKCFRYSISTFKHVTVSCKVSAGTCKSKGPLERLLHHSAWQAPDFFYRHYLKMFKVINMYGLFQVLELQNGSRQDKRKLSLCPWYSISLLFCCRCIRGN